MKIRQDLNVILKNERGVAIMMIMTAIILLMAIYGEFTFESKIARLKATNILDKSQAKLVAESGLQLAMARIRLYKEAYNAIQGNPNAKQMVQGQLLNQLWEVPFIYPIPVGKGVSQAFKATVDKFSQEMLLEGEMKVSIQNISNRLNLNMLRIDMTKYNPDPNANDGMDHSSLLNMSDQAIMTDVNVDQSLFYLLKRLVDQKKEDDEAFDDKYGAINYQEMLTTLKYYMSDYGSMQTDPMMPEAETNFSQANLHPKFGPMGSASELYAIPGWDDQLIELIQNEFSVYPSTQIDFNKLTANMLKILIPNMTDDQIKDFFIWRDDPEQPKYLNSKADFKNYICTIERIMSDTDFDNRMNLFEQKGITFGSNPNLFKVVSEGTYNRSTYTLVAYVVIPKTETNKPAQQCPQGQVYNAQTKSCQPQQGGTPATTPGTTTNPGTATASTDQDARLLEPRIIEIQVN